jgi:hypothetical protein
MTSLFRFKPALLAVIAMAAMGASPGFAATMSKADYQAAKTRIGTELKAEKAACDKFSGNAQDVCEEEAEAKEKVARAELEANYTGKPADTAKLARVKAEATYEVAKERCDDRAGNEKDVCVKEAQAARDKAEADAKMAQQTTEARAEGADEKRDADYKVALERCDSLAGDAKSSCIASAKANFGKR